MILLWLICLLAIWMIPPTLHPVDFCNKRSRLQDRLLATHVHRGPGARLVHVYKARESLLCHLDDPTYALLSCKLSDMWRCWICMLVLFGVVYRGKKHCSYWLSHIRKCLLHNLKDHTHYYLKKQWISKVIWMHSSAERVVVISTLQLANAYLKGSDLFGVSVWTFWTKLGLNNSCTVC